MKMPIPCRALAVLIALATVTNCGLGTEAEPTALYVPKDVFPPDAKEKNEFDLSVNTTFHPVYFFKDDVLVEVRRQLPAPVFLDDPLTNLLSGPTESEAEAGFSSAIPAGTAVVDVGLLTDDTISIHLNQTFFEIEGEQRIRASAQLVFTASALIGDSQGIKFFLDGEPVQLPDGEGLIEEVPEGQSPSALTIDDYLTLADVAAKD